MSCVAIQRCAERAERDYIDKVCLSEWGDAAEAALATASATLVVQHVEATTVYMGTSGTTHVVFMARPELLLTAIHCVGTRSTAKRQTPQSAALP